MVLQRLHVRVAASDVDVMNVLVQIDVKVMSLLQIDVDVAAVITITMKM